jgi:hypothetical protein
VSLRVCSLQRSHISVPSYWKPFTYETIDHETSICPPNVHPAGPERVFNVFKCFRSHQAIVRRRPDLSTLSVELAQRIGSSNRKLALKFGTPRSTTVLSLPVFSLPRYVCRSRRSLSGRRDSVRRSPLQSTQGRTPEKDNWPQKFQPRYGGVCGRYRGCNLDRGCILPLITVHEATPEQ